MIFFIAFSALHVCFFLWLRYHWGRIGISQNQPGHIQFISVIVPVRNEAGNIRKLLKDLENQDYPKGSYEVIIVDDHSEDSTLTVCREYLQKSSLSHQIITLSQVSGKKEAITAGVEKACGELILTTDGDCRLEPGWVTAFATAYHLWDPVMLAGPVRMEGDTFFQKLQLYEFAALIGVGAASLKSGNPGMCNGANLSYKKKAFLEVNGYEGNKHIPSGDDEFLLQKLYVRYPDKVRFLKNPNAVVTTGAKNSLKELVNQRIRWAGKWKFHKRIFIQLMAIMIFLNYFFLVFAFVQSLGNWHMMGVFFAVFIIRWGVVYVFVKSVLRFLQLRRLFFVSLAGEIFYPLFVTFLGLASIFGKYSWKGRQYK